jgi:D-alanyl-D-alanine dipeptidase
MIIKLSGCLKIIGISTIIIVFSWSTVVAQLNAGNKYGLVVINNVKLLQNEIATDSNKQMLDVKKFVPFVVLDLRYASVNNFLNRRLYPPVHTTYLRLAAVNALKKVAIDLRSKHLALKIFDAYRPYSVTEAIWNSVKDDRYAADPAKGSGHNRGIAVDVTLVDLNTKNELPMGTGFDNFSDSAHQDFTQLPELILKNRALLKSVMEEYGFISLDSEWWHYSLPDAKYYELLNVSFADLQAMSN